MEPILLIDRQNRRALIMISFLLYLYVMYIIFGCFLVKLDFRPELQAKDQSTSFYIDLVSPNIFPLITLLLFRYTFILLN